MLKFLFNGFLFSNLFFAPGLVLAQNMPTLNQYIPNYKAYRGVRILIPRGLGVNISFMGTGERIRRIWLDDLTEIVVDIDEPLPEARIIHLKRISELLVPLQIRAKPRPDTLMTVVTNQQIYQFILTLVDRSSVQTVHIIPERNPILEIDSTTVARLSHVENGLNQAIAQRRMLADSPLVIKVREFILEARRGVPLPQAAQNQGLYLSFIYELARMGLKTPVRPFIPRQN